MERTYITSQGPVTLKEVGVDWIVSNLHTGLDVGFSHLSEAVFYIQTVYAIDPDNIAFWMGE